MFITPVEIRLNQSPPCPPAVIVSGLLLVLVSKGGTHLCPAASEHVTLIGAALECEEKEEESSAGCEEKEEEEEEEEEVQQQQQQCE
ncbi:hypothetical protein JOB18_031942 [Solea senegalensis]|uniref:Uncharacterized protein n=1 Tax=Solea senegalensis TaxID=28829 RepID=A0AAV6QIU8_SOLSE|nr:hypothetical protein JOB18_031942 [Solea senegalensis]